jgi:diguanylate cyclase
MGSVLKNTLKGRDTAARYGGEEFAVVLPETKLSDAMKLAEDIRQRLANKEMINRKNGERLGRITVSIGAAVYELGERIPDLVERADQALYAAKKSGRNRVVSEEALKVKKVAFGT